MIECINKIRKNQNQMLLHLVILLAVAATLSGTSIGQAKAWPGYGYGWYKWYQPVGSGCGYGYSCWYNHVKATGWQQGYDDGSQNIAYSCEGHTALFCAAYGQGWASGQDYYNNNQQTDTGTSTNQGQGQDQSSTAYAQSNPNVHVTVNNIVPSAGVGNTGEGSGYQGQDPK